MKITIISGQNRCYHLNKFYKDESIEGQRYFFPEIVGSDMLQAYDTMERVVEKCDMYLKLRRSLVIFTYSKVVLDSVRLWAVKNKCTYAVECLCLLQNGDITKSRLSPTGEFEHMKEGIFDFEQFVEKELSKLNGEYAK